MVNILQYYVFFFSPRKQSIAAELNVEVEETHAWLSRACSKENLNLMWWSVRLIGRKTKK